MPEVWKCRRTCVQLVLIAGVKPCSEEHRRLTWIKSSADHSWHDNEKHREDFQISSQHWSTFGMGEVLGGEGPLNYHLQLVRKRVGSRTEALQREQDPSFLSCSWMTFTQQDPRLFCMPMATFPSQCLQPAQSSAHRLWERAEWKFPYRNNFALDWNEATLGTGGSSCTAARDKEWSSLIWFSERSVVGFDDYPILNNKNKIL